MFFRSKNTDLLIQINSNVAVLAQSIKHVEEKLEENNIETKKINKKIGKHTKDKSLHHCSYNEKKIQDLKTDLDNVASIMRNNKEEADESFKVIFESKQVKKIKWGMFAKMCTYASIVFSLLYWAFEEHIKKVASKIITIIME